MYDPVTKDYIVIHCELNIPGMSGDTAYCMWDHDGKALSIFNISAHAFTALKSLRVAENKTSLQGYTVTFSAWGNVQGGWADLITGGTCAPASNS